MDGRFVRLIRSSAAHWIALLFFLPQTAIHGETDDKTKQPLSVLRCHNSVCGGVLSFQYGRTGTKLTVLG